MVQPPNVQAQLPPRVIKRRRSRRLQSIGGQLQRQLDRLSLRNGIHDIDHRRDIEVRGRIGVVAS
jgi:hypothetical protein